MMNNEDDFEDDDMWVLTVPAIMQYVLRDFDIDVNLTVAKAISTEFMEQLEKSGYVERKGD